MNLTQIRRAATIGNTKADSAPVPRRSPRRVFEESGDLPIYLRRARLESEPTSAVLARSSACGCGVCAACSAAAGVRLSEASDSLEQEADAIADHVMRSPAPGTPARVRSQQASAASSANASLVPAGGDTLDATTRAYMEPRFGADFGAVQVHSGTTAAGQAARFSARAYTVGEHVVFGAGQYQPGSEAGRRLLAHELAHVVQQRAGKVGGTLLRKSSFKSCTGNQPAQLDAAVATAETAMSRAAGVVAGAYGRPAHVSAADRQLLLDHFHTTSQGDMRDILHTYVSIQAAFRKGLSLQCESTCPTTATTQTCGYAYNHQWFGGSGPIHICFDPAGCDFATTPAPNQTALVIHEAAHRHAGIDDKAYRWEPAYPTLSAKQAKDNADSYAWFATLV